MVLFGHKKAIPNPAPDISTLCLISHPCNAAEGCNVRIQAGRGRRTKWIPLNEVLLFSKAGRPFESNAVKPIIIAEQGGTWQALAALCVDGRNDTSCFNPNATGSGNVTLVISFPCSGSGLDELDKMVLVNTK